VVWGGGRKTWGPYGFLPPPRIRRADVSEMDTFVPVLIQYQPTIWSGPRFKNAQRYERRPDRRRIKHVPANNPDHRQGLAGLGKLDKKSGRLRRRSRPPRVPVVTVTAEIGDCSANGSGVEVVEQFRG